MVLNLSLFHAAFYATTLGIRSPEKQGRLKGEVSGQLILLGRVSAEENRGELVGNPKRKGMEWEKEPPKPEKASCYTVKSGS